MNLRKCREEIPIWWRSDSSSKGNNSEKNKKDHLEVINDKLDKSTHAKTLKKWFPEAKVDNSYNHSKKVKNERNSKKKSNSKEKLSKGLEETSLRKNSSENKPTSVCSSRISFVIPDNYSDSKNHETESICTFLNNSSSSLSSLSYSSSSSSSIEYSNFSSLPSSIFSPVTITCSNPYSSSLYLSSSSSSSCSSCISSSCSSFSSTSYIDSSALSNLSPSSTPRKGVNTKNETEKKLKEKKNDPGNYVMKTVDSLKKAILSVQKLPEVNEIPLDPYFINEQNNYLKLNKKNKEQNNRIIEEIREFEGWENLEKVFSNEKSFSINEKAFYSFEVDYINIDTKEIIISDDIELRSIFPRVTLNIKSGFGSSKSTQISKKTFSFRNSKLSWGSNNSADQVEKESEKIHFSMLINQIEDHCNYFYLTIEGVNLNEINNSNSDLKKINTILGTAFCPLPKNNDKWNVSIPIYSCFPDGTFLDTKDSQLISNIFPNVFKKLGKINFKLSRKEPKVGTESEFEQLLELNKVSSKMENKTTKEIRDEILSCLSNMNLIGNKISIENNQNPSIKKSIVTGEVAQTIFSKDYTEIETSIKEKELQLREREIQIREKELELQMRSLTVQNLEQKTELGNIKNPDEIQIEVETNKLPYQQDHSNHAKQLNYFRVKDKSRETYNRIQLVRSKKSGILSSGLKRNNETPKPIINKESSYKEISKRYCKHRKKNTKTREKQKKKNEDSVKQDLKEQNIYSPVQVPLLVNNLPFAPQFYTNNVPQNYVLCYPSVSSINKENSLVQTQTQVQFPHVSLEPLKITNRNIKLEEGTKIHNNLDENQINLAFHNVEASRDFVSRSPKVNIDSLVHSKPFIERRKIIRNSNNIIKTNSVKNISEDEEKEIEEFLRSQWNMFSINCETILNKSGVCSNSFCHYRNNGRMEYSKCEYTNTEIDNWKICQYCQMELFPSLYFINIKRPKFVEFFFDSSIPIFFPSRQLIWPTSFHFLLAQFFSNYSEVRECKTHDQIISLAKKRQNSISIEILPNLAIIVLAMKVFQHSVLQQLLLSFSKNEFFLLREYWIKYDPIIKLVSSDSKTSLSSLGESLITTLEELRSHIQRNKN
ncbi:uncharacterized protein ELE39_000290 [Cryptosporidium sp. chipmunk genotype I]|uniref:uncharacterized protein n=1 Tax=Cryptosporidium sp. chipmunk genotype I TaxID=1280935 RepID=UPI00351AB005|nr:hypothetical protein ELE39_000290 [Cryptosporidium sp. chipmunk genotype I]